MDYLSGLLGIRGMDLVPNAQIREFCRVMKGLMVRPYGENGEGKYC